MKPINKIVLAGGTGQIGKALAEFYKNKAQEIIILSRTAKPDKGNTKTIVWDGATQGTWTKALEGADMLINLTGKNVNCRYNEQNTTEIIASRVHSVNALGAAISGCKNPPKLWVQLASATIYRHAEDRTMDEFDGELGFGFSEQVCRQWEQTYNEAIAKCSGTRNIVLRTSLVLSKNEGVFPRLKNMAKWGLGGRQGNGRQWVSWIHEDDVTGIIDWLLNNPNLNGVFNCTAPNPIKNTEFMALFRKALRVKFGLPAPNWMMELGALLIGTETELVLKSRWVLPTHALKEGYQFKYPTLESALKNLTHK